MRIGHEKFSTLTVEGDVWQYWLDTFFAILPTILNTGGVFPKIVWLRRYWQAYPVNGSGKTIEAYRTTYTDDPRKSP